MLVELPDGQVFVDAVVVCVAAVVVYDVASFMGVVAAAMLCLLLLLLCVLLLLLCVVAGVRRTSVAGLGLSSGEDSSQLAPVATGTSPPMQTLAPAQAAQHGN